MARAFRPGETPSSPRKAAALNPLTALRGKASVLSATARWIASFRAEIPTGYEDETGFHFGPPPSENQDQQPRA
jgi:hypothetical protein